MKKTVTISELELRQALDLLEHVKGIKTIPSLHTILNASFEDGNLILETENISDEADRAFMALKEILDVNY